MLLEQLYFIGGLSFLLTVLGLFLKDKLLTFAGSMLLILTGLILVMPPSMAGGLEIFINYNETVAYQYFNYTVNDSVPVYELANTTAVVTKQKESLGAMWSNIFGFVLIAIALYIALMTHLDRLGSD